jgi:hypothetical protein
VVQSCTVQSGSIKSHAIEVAYLNSCCVFACGCRLRSRRATAPAAIEVLKHYRTGKWNGFSTRFRYVEIWNEPDNKKFWPRPRTPLDYFQLYHEAAVAIKQQFPELKVGGPAVTQAGALIPQGKKWTQDFLDFVRQKNAPLDFFSWRMYSNNPGEYAEAAKFYRSLLDARGLTHATMHITEWNTDVRDLVDDDPEALALRTGGKGAAILTAAWISLQCNGVDESTFYRGPDPDTRVPTFYGLFYADGSPKRSALAFSLWSKMASENRPIRVGISFADQRPIHKITTYQVSHASDKVQTSALNGTVFELGGYSVSLVTID